MIAAAIHMSDRVASPWWPKPRPASPVQPRALSPSQDLRLRGLRHMARLLDSAFEVPGLKYRFGLDPIIGLVPGLGDLVSPLFTIFMLVVAWDLGLPRVVQARMIGNAAI